MMATFQQALSWLTDEAIAVETKRKGTSLNAFAYTLGTNLIIFVVLFSLFLILRRTYTRIYSPRAFAGSIPHEKHPELLPNGVWVFLRGLAGLSDSYTIAKTSLDAYLFLRFLRTTAFICAIGTLLTGILLLPFNGTGSNSSTGLDQFSLSNIGKDQNSRLYAHAVIAWVFFSFVVFVVYRELRFYIALRNAYVTSPLYAKRISAKTLLVTCIPAEYLSKNGMMEVFDDVVNVWINKDVSRLEKMVEERAGVVETLERAELKYLQAVNLRRGKQPDSDTPEDNDEEDGLVGSKWATKADRLTQWKSWTDWSKNDAIKINCGKLERLNGDIKTLQKGDRLKSVNSAFIEFTTQRAAQSAYQAVVQSTPTEFAPRYIAIHPEEVIWSNMNLNWWSRTARIAATSVFIFSMILFWAVPVGLVSALSSIDSLTTQFKFLGFLNDLPDLLYGLIKGFLPTIMLATLMAVVPIFLRLLARLSGAPSDSLVELQVQLTYFIFQVTQVFLITTIGSSATEVFQKITDNPKAATSILAKSLPKSANFYISYILLQGLSLSASRLLQLFVVFTIKIVHPLLDSTPRHHWDRWMTLYSLGWGTLFPVYTNLAVIALAYAIIAPLILPFAAGGLIIFYMAYKYNFIFVYNNTTDTKGAVYPLAIQQLFAGVYIGELCLIGLFGIRQAQGPTVLLVLLLALTVYTHVMIRRNLGELVDKIPISILAHEGEEQHCTAQVPEPAYSASYSSLPLFFHPTQDHISRLVNTVLPDIVEGDANAYTHPALRAKEPVVWIPRDEAGVSKTEIGAVKEEYGIDMSDEGAWLDEKGRMRWEPIKDGRQVNAPGYKKRRMR